MAILIVSVLNHILLIVYEPVWVVQKMRFDDDVVFTSISIMRYDF